MRIRLGLTLAIACLATAADAQPAPGRRAASDFHRYADVHVEGSLAPDAAYAVLLGLDATAAYRLGDEIRLFDGRGEEIPSLVHAREERQTKARALTVFNRAWEPGLLQTLTVDQDAAHRQTAVNEFTFEIADEQYNVRVQVEGGDDLTEWRVLRDDLHLIRHTIPGEKIRYVHNTLRVPTSRYRYYRFMLAASGRAEPLQIDRVTVRQTIREPDALITRALQPAPWAHPTDQDERHSYWMLDLEEETLGISQIRLTLDGGNFARSATIWAWDPVRRRLGQRLASTVLYRYDSDTATTLRGFQSDARQLVVMIDQGDDAPVRVIGAIAARPRLEVRFLAQAEMALPLRLYCVPDEARAPTYDLDRRLQKRDVAHYTPLTHGPIRDNPDYAKRAPRPASERVPYLLYALVIPLVIALGWYIARTVQGGPPPEAPPADS